MQFLFDTENPPQSYTDKKGKYPEAPDRCPHCSHPVKMRKHGFYVRYIIIFDFAGNIYIRRYICEKCKRTVSMLPSFCIPRYQYGAVIIIVALLTSITNSARYAETKWSERPRTLTRRHIILYRRRVERNRKRIQLGLNLISPEFIEMQQITGDTEWTRSFLKAVHQTNPSQFNSKYYNLLGKSFMSLHNSVA